MNTFLCTMIVFLCTLDGFVRLRAILALFVALIFLVINFNSIEYFRVSRKHIVFSFFASILFIFYTILAIVNPDYYLQIPYDKEVFVFKVFDRLSLLILFFLIPFIFINKNNNTLNIFKNVTYFHSFIFIFQFVLYYIFSIKLDITSFLGIDQRTNFSLDGINFFRASGLYVEPSNYTAFIATMFFPYIYMKKKLTYWDYIPIFTMFLTFSTAGFVTALFYTLGFFVKNRLIYKIKGILLSVLFILSCFIFASFHLDRLESDNGVSSNLRSDLVNYVVEDRINNIPALFFGTGIYSYDYYIYMRETSSSGRDIASIQDFTIFLYNFITLGLFGILILFYLLLKTKGFSNKFFVFAIFISKMTYLFPIFIFFVVYILYAKKEEVK